MDRLRAYQVLSVVRSCVLASPDKSHPWKPNVPWYTKLPKFGPHKIKIYTVYILYLLYTLYISSLSVAHRTATVVYRILFCSTIQ